MIELWAFEKVECYADGQIKAGFVVPSTRIFAALRTCASTWAFEKVDRAAVGKWFKKTVKRADLTTNPFTY